ncbi:MAG: four helix bundle protein [Chitinophagaceae bacterium]|nr:four helix bundle protein [Chitinophagaceae bacterium]
MQDLKTRTFHYAFENAKLVKDIPYDAVNREYISQLVRCTASVGANYRAAKRGKSDADFLNKLKIVEEECDESIYFLELLKALNPSFEKRINELIKEGNELLKIFVASIITTRERINNKKN